MPVRHVGGCTARKANNKAQRLADRQQMVEVQRGELELPESPYPHKAV